MILISEGNFGMAGDALEAFIKSTDKITLKPYWPLDEKQLFQHQKDLKNNFVYVVFPHREQFPDFWPLKLIKKYKKSGNKSAIYFFQLTP